MDNKKRILMCLLVFFSWQGVTAELKFYSAHFPPYAFQNAQGEGGAIYDVVQEIIKRVGYKNKIEFIPWARARFEAEKNNGIIIFPLARTKDREEKYTWLLHILDDPYVLVALRDSHVDISTLKAAKNLKIGILASSVAQNLMKELGFTNLEAASTDVQNVKKLKLGRIDAWVAPLSCINQYKAEAGIGGESMKIGVELTRLKEYVGASKTLDKETILRWEKTFEQMKKDGTYNEIMKKYGITAL